MRHPEYSLFFKHIAFAVKRGMTLGHSQIFSLLEQSGNDHNNDSTDDNKEEEEKLQRKMKDSNNNNNNNNSDNEQRVEDKHTIQIHDSGLLDKDRVEPQSQELNTLSIAVEVQV